MNYYNENTQLSIVVPLLNERESLHDLYVSINESLGAAFRYEIIFVDDGSTDGSYEKIKSLAKENTKIVKGIRLRRNFGKSCALNAGFRLASGDVIVTMDADLQDDPHEIPRLLEKLKSGDDLVSGWKQQRNDPVLLKNIPSKLFNCMVRWGAGLKLHDFNCGLKAYRRPVIEKLHLYGEMHRFIPALAHSMGFRVAEMPVKHHARRYGNSKFGLSRFTHGFFDFMTVMFITKFLKRPMHLFAGLGCVFSASGLIICMYLTVLWFSGEVIGNRPLLALGVLLIIVGIQMITTGLVAEMLVFNNRKSDSDDIVDEVHGFD